MQFWLGNAFVTHTLSNTIHTQHTHAVIYAKRLCAWQLWTDGRLGSRNGLRVNVIQVIVTEPGNCITGRHTKNGGCSIISWNGAAQDRPEEHRSQTKEATAQQTEIMEQ